MNKVVRDITCKKKVSYNPGTPGEEDSEYSGTTVMTKNSIFSLSMFLWVVLR